MNRRRFLGILSAAVVTTCVATTLPTDWLPATVKREGALEYLRRAWNGYYAEHKQRPEGMLVSPALWAAYYGELKANARFCSADPEYTKPTLIFKSTVVMEDERLTN